ncbi:unnamed protein product [Ixodes hexagonus]
MKWSLNKKLLPLKIHYFLCGAHISARVYYTSVGRRIGIPEETIAYIFGVLPLVLMLGKFVTAYIVDKTKRAGAMLIALQVILLVSNGVTFFSHNIHDRVQRANVSIQCTGGKLPALNQSVNTVLIPLNRSELVVCNESCPGNESTPESVKTSMTFLSKDESISCSQLTSRNETLINKTSCELSCTDNASTVNMFNLWLYIVFVSVAMGFSKIAMVVTDAATCEVLGENGRFMGKQRLWSFASDGICSLLIGVLIDVANNATEGRAGFSPWFYLVAAFALLDMLLLFLTPRLRMSKRSTSFFKDTWTVLKSLEMIVFSLFSCFIGAFAAFHISYNVWFLEDIGSSQFTIGLASAVQHFAVQVPLLFLSGHIFKKLGYFLTCSLIFLAFGLKFVGVSFIYNPWYALIVDAAYGAAHALMTGIMPAFAQDHASGGTMTTILSMLITCVEGSGEYLSHVLLRRLHVC